MQTLSIWGQKLASLQVLADLKRLNYILENLAEVIHATLREYILIWPLHVIPNYLCSLVVSFIIKHIALCYIWVSAIKALPIKWMVLAFVTLIIWFYVPYKTPLKI